MAENNGTPCQTQTGRIVWGNPGKAVEKKHQDGPLKGQPVIKNGAPVLEWSCGVAFPKAEFQQFIWPFMAAEIAKGYPNGAPARFAYKYVDGDGVDSNGKPYSAREGYAGCYVLTIKTELEAPPLYAIENGAYVPITPQTIKTGDYVACALNFVVNVATGTNTPSIYINPICFVRVAYGTEIINRPPVDPNALFGGANFAIPAGASMTPIMPQAATGAPGMPGQPAMQPMAQQPMAQQPMAQQPMAQQPMAQQPMAAQPVQQFVQPATGFVDQAMGMPGQPAMQPAQAGMPGMIPGR